MKQHEAEKVAHEVTEAIKELDHLYVVILLRKDGERDVKIKVKGRHYAN